MIPVAVFASHPALRWLGHTGSCPLIAAAKACCALMSDWFPATTGEIVHVDGGYHAVGAAQ